MTVFPIVFSSADNCYVKDIVNSYEEAVKYFDELEQSLKSEGLTVLRPGETEVEVEEYDGSYFMNTNEITVDSKLEMCNLHETILQQIKKLTASDKKEIFEKVTKMYEETGELAGALLSNLQSHGSGYKKISDDEVLNEFADSYLTLLSVFYEYGKFTEEDLFKAIQQKNKKWALNQQRG